MILHSPFHGYGCVMVNQTAMMTETRQKNYAASDFFPIIFGFDQLVLNRRKNAREILFQNILYAKMVHLSVLWDTLLV